MWHKNLSNKINIGQQPIFHGPVILPYNCKTIWWMKFILDIMDQCDTKIDHIKYIGQWPTFHGPVILPYILKTIWWLKALDNGSVWHIDWPHKIYVGQWPLFCGAVILLYIFNTIWWWNIIFGIIDQCDTKVGIIKQMWVSDLYFMVQWFCLMFWRLFDGWRSYLQ